MATDPQSSLDGAGRGFTIYHQVQAQASVMAYVDVFVLMTGVLLLFLPLIPILRSRAAQSAPQSSPVMAE